MSRLGSRWQRQRGVSLVEALVALAVMAFGMLGMAGIQSSLRANSDVARQRSEAVRIAQESIERSRGYSATPAVPVPVAGNVYFDALVSVGETDVVGYTTNTTYKRTITVGATPTQVAQNYKSYVVEVKWTDRTNTQHAVRLATTIHRSPPELGAALSIPGSGTVTQRPAGRHPSVPRGAVDQGDGTSRYEPPGGGTIAWIINNMDGLITRRCDGVVCTAVTGRLIAGFISFSTGSTAPTPADAENPGSTAMPAGIGVSQSYPGSVPAPECFTQASAFVVAYVCLVHVDPGGDKKWSGQSLLTGLTLAASASDADAAKFRVCRYTPYRSNVAVGTVVPGVAPTVTMQNYDHPLTYALVDRSFLDHNFLVIRAGDGSAAFACPADDPGTPFNNTNTYDHQPAS